MKNEPMTHEQAMDLAAAYVLGALEPAEEAAVREHLQTCAQSHEEFAELGGVVPYLAEIPDLELVEPPASLRDRIMAAAAADLETRRQGAPPVATAPAPKPETPAIAFPSDAERQARRGRTSGLEWALRIAAVIAIVALGAWNFQLQDRIGSLQQQVAAARQYQTAVATVLEVSFEAGSQTAVLKPQEAGGPRGIAAVAPNGSIQFAVQDLAPTTGNEVYETWAIVGDQPPVPLGSFTVDQSGTASFTSVPGPAVPGVVVAVSREPQAGAKTPTKVVSVGAATPGSS